MVIHVLDVTPFLHLLSLVREVQGLGMLTGKSDMVLLADLVDCQLNYYCYLALSVIDG
jgi:hypothetical protein